jgi:hypothetical protein
MIPFKEFKKAIEIGLKKRDAKIPTMETVFGSHAYKKPEDMPNMETKFGKHSDKQKDVLKEEKEEERTKEEHDHVHDHVAPFLGSKLSVEERNHVHKYTKGSKELNGSLHKHAAGRDIDDHNKEQAHALTKILDKHKTKEDTHVYTGIPKSPAEHFKDHNKPTTVHLPAFTSTSTSRKTAKAFCEFGHHKNDAKHGVVHDKNDKVAAHILKIHVPKGTSAASIRKQSDQPTEHEVLLNRGHHVEIHPKPEHIGNNIHVWHAKIVAHKPKDLDHDD